MNYCSPNCPDDSEVFTTNGKMKISKLYYKMNPKRDPYNRILDIQNLFLSKCVSPERKDKNHNQSSFKEIKDINDYYNKINKNINYNLNDNNNQKEFPHYFNDFSNIFQTSINVYGTKNDKSSGIEKQNNSNSNNINNSNATSNLGNDSSNNTNRSKSIFNKPKILNHSHSHSYVLKLDRTYYKSPTLNKKICVLNHKDKKENYPSLINSSSSSYFLNYSDNAKYKNFIPFAKPNYLNVQFDFDLSTKAVLGQLKQYQIKEIQDRNKLKPFIH
jgi:hypothetical protein